MHYYLKGEIVDHQTFCEAFVAALVAAGVREGMTEREVLGGMCKMLNELENDNGVRS